MPPGLERNPGVEGPVPIRGWPFNFLQEMYDEDFAVSFVFSIFLFSFLFS